MNHLALVSTALLLAPLAVNAADAVTQSSWFPTAEDSSWTYQLADKKVTVKVTKHEKQAGQMTARFETLDKDDVVGVQHLAVTDKGVLRVTHNGEKVNPPLLLLQQPPAKGQSWEVNSTLTTRSGTDTITGKFTTDEEDIKVPAGEYKKAIRVTADLTINDRKLTVVAWYAEKTGMVKQRVVFNGQEQVMELIKAELPK